MKAVLIAMELSVYFRPYHHTNSKLKLCYLRAGSDNKVTLLLESLFFLRFWHKAELENPHNIWQQHAAEDTAMSNTETSKLRSETEQSCE